MTETPKHQHHDDQDQPQDGQVSEGPNSLSTDETDLGGADAVPDKTTGADGPAPGEEQGPE